VKFNADGIVRVTLLDRYQAHKLGIEAGFLTRNEAGRSRTWRRSPKATKVVLSHDDRSSPVRHRRMVARRAAVSLRL
jgi:hypothetical protein